MHHPKFNRFIFYCIISFASCLYYILAIYSGYINYNTSYSHTIPIFTGIINSTLIQDNKMNFYYLLSYFIQIPTLLSLFSITMIICLHSSWCHKRNTGINTTITNDLDVVYNAGTILRTPALSVISINSTVTPAPTSTHVRSTKASINSASVRVPEFQGNTESLLGDAVEIDTKVQNINTNYSYNYDCNDEKQTILSEFLSLPVYQFIIKLSINIAYLLVVLFIYLYLIKLIDTLDDAAIVNYYTEISYTFILGSVIFKYIFRDVSRRIDRMRIDSNLLVNQLKPTVVSHDTIINTNIESILQTCNSNISFELVTMIFVDANYWIRDRYLTVYFDHVTYENFFLFKILHVGLELFETFVKMTPLYFDITNYLYDKYLRESCLFKYIIQYDNCNQQIWLNRSCIDISFRFIIANVCTLYIGLRYMVAVFTDWENIEYSYDQAIGEIEKHFILWLLTFSIEALIYLSVRWWFWRTYHYDMFSMYEYVMENVKSKGLSMFWCFAIAFQTAIWLW